MIKKLLTGAVLVALGISAGVVLGSGRQNGVMPSVSKKGNVQAVYMGGEVLKQAQMVIIFWGSGWKTSTVGEEEVRGATQSVLEGPYLDALGQYGVERGSLVGSVRVENENVRENFTTADVEKLLQREIAQGAIANPSKNSNLLYVVVVSEGSRTKEKAEGMHSYFDYFNGGSLRPRASRAHFAWVLGIDDLGSLMMRLTHEVVEAVSDPNGDGWKVKGGVNGLEYREGWVELSDACLVADLFQAGPEERASGVRVGSYWSQRDQACVVPSEKGWLRYSASA